MEFILEFFGPLEWLLFLEFVILATATFFYQAAKLIAGKNRDDEMVRFYHVFWRSFFAPVTPVNVMLAREAEIRARAMGVVMAGDMAPEQLNQMDAPDLDALSGEDLRGRAIETPVPMRAESKAEKKAAAAVPPLADSTLEVRINGRAPSNRVTGHSGRTLLIDVTHEIEDGQANGVVVELASQALDVPIYRIVLIRGHYRSDKAFKILGVEQAMLESRIQQL